MPSDAIPPYDEERMSLGMLVESVAEPESEPPDSGSDTASEIAFEQLLELLSVDSCTDDDDDDDDADIISSFAHPSMSDQDIFEWQESVSAEPGTPLADLIIHTTRVPVHLQAEMPGRYRWPALRTHLSHTVSGPDCWIGLSIGEPPTDVSFRHFGMVQWSHTPYISFGSQYTLPRTFRCSRAPLGSLNGVSQCSTAEPGGAGTVFYPQNSLLPLLSS